MENRDNEYGEGGRERRGMRVQGIREIGWKERQRGEEIFSSDATLFLNGAHRICMAHKYHRAGLSKIARKSPRATGMLRFHYRNAGDFEEH